jgi:hypothetical protein
MPLHSLQQMQNATNGQTDAYHRSRKALPNVHNVAFSPVVLELVE